MAITFPSSPVDGQLFTATESDNKKTYIYQSAKGRWRIRTDSDLLFVSTPKINSPTDNYQYASRTLTLTSSDYYPNDNTGLHEYSQWQLSTTDSFTTTVYDSGESSSKTSITIPPNTLDYGTTYYARVRYFSEVSNGLGRATSNWSPTVTFRTDVNPGSTWVDVKPTGVTKEFAGANYRITPELTKEIVYTHDSLAGNDLPTYYSTDNGLSWNFQKLYFSSGDNFQGIYKYIWNGYRWYVLYDKQYGSRGINYINGTDNNTAYYSLWTHNYTYTTTFIDAVWNGIEFICLVEKISGGNQLFLTINSVNDSGNWIVTPAVSLSLDSSLSSTPSTDGYPKLCYLSEDLEPSSAYTYRYHVAWKYRSYDARFIPSQFAHERFTSVDYSVKDAAYLKLGSTWYFYVARENGGLNRLKLDSGGAFTTFLSTEGPDGSNISGDYDHVIDSQTTQHLNSIAVKQGTCAIIVGNNKTILKTNVNSIGDGYNNPGSHVTKYDTTSFASSNYNKVIYNADYDVWVIIGTQGVILTSTDDGETWNVKSSGTTQSLREIIWTGDHFFLGGNGGTLLKG